MSQIVVQNLCKTFHVPVRREGQGFFGNLFHPEKRIISAVDTISFSVEQGQRVACIGPNGAGKSTTIKMLTGILYPTSGEATVAGIVPWKQRQKLAKRIGVLFGQRTSLILNLPARDSFELYGALYEIPRAAFLKRQKRLVQEFDLTSFFDQPVRKLSLGQRMRAEMAVALIHTPEIIFLDEPTIGLDVVAKQALRDVLLTLNTQEGTTLFLTSHDAGDIEALCERTILVNHGRIVVDAPTRDLSRQLFTRKDVRVEFAEDVATFRLRGASEMKQQGRVLTFTVDTKKRALDEVLSELLATHRIVDLDVSQPDLEEVMKTLYARNQ